MLRPVLPLLRFEGLPVFGGVFLVPLASLSCRAAEHSLCMLARTLDTSTDSLCAPTRRGCTSGVSQVAVLLAESQSAIYAYTSISGNVRTA